jgi:hypothetical protein
MNDAGSRSDANSEIIVLVVGGATELNARLSNRVTGIC